MEQAPNKIEIQANEWAIRLDAGPLSVEEQTALDRWLAADRRHHGALVRARAAWLDTDRLAAMLPQKAPDLPLCHRKAKRQVRYAIAATIAALSIVIGGLWHYNPSAGNTYTSEIGEIRNIQLPDGSELTLNTNTKATVLLKDSERNISLKRGEALFKVAHDSSRPFIVHANDVQVRAVGTAFTVRVDDARVDVIVTEGAVEVSRAGTATVQRLSANHRALIASSASRLDIESIDSTAVNRQLAWREGMASFAGEPLSVAVAEINRYSRTPIYIDDPALAAQPVVGIFHANDAEGFANAAAATFNAEVIEDAGAIHLRERSITQ